MTLTLCAAGATVEVSGRTAAMVAALVAHQARINQAGPLGKVVLAYNASHVVPVLEESLGKYTLQEAA